MNTMFQFRTEIDTYPKQIQGEIYMECELFFQSTLEKIKSNLVKNNHILLCVIIVVNS